MHLRLISLVIAVIHIVLWHLCDKMMLLFSYICFFLYRYHGHTVCFRMGLCADSRRRSIWRVSLIIPSIYFLVELWN